MAHAADDVHVEESVASPQIDDPLVELTREEPLKWGLLLYPMFEALDVFGPLEALNTLYRQGTMQNSLEIIGNYDNLNPVTTGPPKDTPPWNPSFQQAVMPTQCIKHYMEAKRARLDVLIVPGGFGSRSSLEHEIAFLQKVYPQLKYLITVCTGSGIAARAGLLDGHTATTNKMSWGTITKMGAKTRWKAKARWTVSGNIWTSSGVSAGTDCMLGFMAYRYGRDAAEIVAQRMEYVWNDDPDNDPFSCGLENVN